MDSAADAVRQLDALDMRAPSSGHGAPLWLVAPLAQRPKAEGIQNQPFCTKSATWNARVKSQHSFASITIEATKLLRCSALYAAT